MLNWVEEPGRRAYYTGMPGPIPGWGNPRGFYLWSIHKLPAGGYKIFGSCNYLNADDVGNNFAVSAISPDGINWVGEKGLRMQTQPDPYEFNSVFPVPHFLDGESVRVFFSTIRNYFGDPSNNVTDSDYPTQSGCSPDGRNFVTEPGIRSASNGWLAGSTIWGDHRSMVSSLVISDSGLRLYQTSRNYMYSDYEYMKSSISPDGLNWSQEPGRRAYQYTAEDAVLYTSLYNGRCTKNDFGLYKLQLRGVNAPGTIVTFFSALSSDGRNFFIQPARKYGEGVWVPISSGSRAYGDSTTTSGGYGGSAITYNDSEEPQIKE